MTGAHPDGGTLDAASVPIVSWVIPVLNEEAQLPDSVPRLSAALNGISVLKNRWEIVIADNGSTDGTNEIGLRLARVEDHVRYLRLQQSGRGRALRRAWAQSASPVLAYSDVDLSTDLRHVPELLDAVLRGGFDLALGSRLAGGSETSRGLGREILSRGYNGLARLILGTQVRDLQCGFKAIKREAASLLLPLVESERWFFDTELVVLAEAADFRLREVAVRWTDDPDTRVRLLPTIVEDLRGLARLRYQLRRKAGVAKSMRAKEAQVPGSLGGTAVVLNGRHR
ncbi:MAG: glycosyltransferase family 2 protein [Verrucomicrobiales bacterium]|nr:glycosyltransferase family 2 protein [Verrucomicrobiales bacterium]